MVIKINEKRWMNENVICEYLDEIWIHKSGEKFMEKDEIITDNIERQFEESLEEN